MLDIFRKKINILIFLFIILLITIVYIFCSYHNSNNIFLPTKRAYYNYLLDGLFHLRLNLLPPDGYDLSSWNGKLYMYWGPGPVLFILPFYLISGVMAGDIFYTMVAGIINIVIFYFLMEEFLKYFNIEHREFHKIFLLLSFAFASPNFYLSLRGLVWQTSQVVAVTYLLFFLFFFFKFLNKRNFIFLALSVFFLNMAWFSRFSLIFYFILFIYLLYIVIKEHDKKLFIKSLIALSSLSLFFAFTFLSYNYLRFGHPLETGLKYQKCATRYKEEIHSGRVLLLKNIPHNMTYYFFNHLQISLEKPFIKKNKEGYSIFSVYPIVILFFFLFQKKFFQNRDNVIFFSFSFLTMSALTTLLLMYVGTGWEQFGSRYFFDVIPLMFLMILFVMKDVPLFFQILLVIYGITVNFIGMVS